MCAQTLCCAKACASIFDSAYGDSLFLATLTKFSSVVEAVFSFKANIDGMWCWQSEKEYVFAAVLSRS